jgi:hypothetical protein
VVVVVVAAAARGVDVPVELGGGVIHASTGRGARPPRLALEETSSISSISARLTIGLTTMALVIPTRAFLWPDNPLDLTPLVVPCDLAPVRKAPHRLPHLPPGICEEFSARATMSALCGLVRSCPVNPLQADRTPIEIGLRGGRWRNPPTRRRPRPQPGGQLRHWA